MLIFTKVNSSIPFTKGNSLSPQYFSVSCSHTYIIIAALQTWLHNLLAGLAKILNKEHKNSLSPQYFSVSCSHTYIIAALQTWLHNLIIAALQTWLHNLLAGLAKILNKEHKNKFKKCFNLTLNINWNEYVPTN